MHQNLRRIANLEFEMVGGEGQRGTDSAMEHKGKGKAKSGDAGANAKDKDGVGLDRCGNCDAEGALRRAPCARASSAARRPTAVRAASG